MKSYNGENVLMNRRPSYWWLMCSKWFMPSILVVPIAIVLLELEPDWMALEFFLVPLAFIVMWYKKHSLKFIVTPKRLVLVKGLLSRDYININISDIRVLNVAQKFVHRLYRVGTLKIGTSGTDKFEQEVWGLKRPREVMDSILNLKEVS